MLARLLSENVKRNKNTSEDEDESSSSEEEDDVEESEEDGDGDLLRFDDFGPDDGFLGSGADRFLVAAAATASKATKTATVQKPALKSDTKDKKSEPKRN